MSYRQRNKILLHFQAPFQASDLPCTVCGGHAGLGYTCRKNLDVDWGGRVKAGERLCRQCFEARNGTLIGARI